MARKNTEVEYTARVPGRSRINEQRKQRVLKKGMPPGTLIHIGKPRSEPVKISVVDYTASGWTAKEVKDPEELTAFQGGPSTTWINVDGINEVEIIGRICDIFHIHPLVQEDIVSTDQRPKMDDSNDYVFIVLKTLNYSEDLDEVIPEQVSLLIGEHFLLSFQEIPGDAFDPIRERIRAGLGLIRKSGPDYLAYALLDAIVDDYFVILEKLAEKIEILEEKLVENPSPDTLAIIHQFKTDMIFLRRSIWPLREVISKLASGQSDLVKDSTRPYFRDVYDHTIHVVDTMETYRDIVSGMLDIYLSSVSNRLNEIMKVLTIIATIFIPLTFLSGWYGMNFKHMPELQWQWGYPMVICIAISTVTTMLVFFWRKKWL